MDKNTTNVWVEYFTKQLEKEIGKIEQKNQFDECGVQLFSGYQSFIKAGFTEEQAFALLLNILSQNKPNAL